MAYAASHSLSSRRTAGSRKVGAGTPVVIQQDSRRILASGPALLSLRILGEADKQGLATLVNRDRQTRNKLDLCMFLRGRKLVLHCNWYLRGVGLFVKPLTFLKGRYEVEG